MTDIIQLKTAKYKGVEFLFSEMPTTGGNRLIKYNYPGSDKQAIERQGKSPRTFSITAIIPHENYYQERDNLLRVLEDGEKGVLTHPTFGDVENVINGVYTLTEKTTSLGRAQIVIPFEVDDASGIPEQSGDLVSQVSQESSLLNAQAESDLANTYKVTNSFAGNFGDAIDTINTVAASFATASLAATPIDDGLSSLTQTLTSFTSGSGDLIQDPTSLSSSISSIFESLNNLYESPSELYDVFVSLFSYGEDDPVISTNTVARTQRYENRQAMTANINTQALSYAYVAAPQIEFSTTEDLDAVQNELEAKYVDIRDNKNISNEAQEQLDIVRVQAQKTFDTVRVNTRSIITVNTKQKPLSVLVYEYYGNTDLVDTIADLNSVKQNAFVEGDVRILTV